MAFDGSIVYRIIRELDEKLTNGRIVKIAQPEKDELLLTIKKEGNQYRLLISVNASLPMVYLTKESKTSPLTAPAFCMLLRKHLTNGRILSITQPSMERIIEFEIEHFNEMGDICHKVLTVELMGKHSNIIFRDRDKILDSIKHVSGLISSVREVLPGREYFIPFAGDKLNPFTCNQTDFVTFVFDSSALPVSKALYTKITGLSPILAEEILYRAGIDSERAVNSINENEQLTILKSFKEVFEAICNTNDYCNIAFKDDEPVFFGAFHYKLYQNERTKDFESVSDLLFEYYHQKQSYTAIRQKTAELRQLVQSLLNKDYKKYDLQQKQIKDAEKKEKYKVFGELLTAYGYDIPANATTYKTINFYTNEEITIPLDPTISAIENGKKYFEKYSKLRRTENALTEIVKQTEEEIYYLESIISSLDSVKDAIDISELKQELIDTGFIKKHLPDKKTYAKKSNSKKGKEPLSKGIKSTPLHYISSDGFHMYVGKNNFQNEYLSFKFADGNDWWFHAKNIPGSHVIVKSKGAELSDKTFEEAASLAAHYSKAKDADRVEIDYTLKKNLKKPAGSKPGFVIYHTNYSMAAITDIDNIEEIL